MSETYTVDQAHADGRHDSAHIADRAHWLNACPRCALEALTDLDDLLPTKGDE